MEVSSLLHSLFQPMAVASSSVRREEYLFAYSSAPSATRDIHGTLGPSWIVLYWSKMLNSRATSLVTNGNLSFYGTLRSDA